MCIYEGIKGSEWKVGWPLFLNCGELGSVVPFTWMKLATWRTSSVSARAHAISWSSGSGCAGGKMVEGGPLVGVGVSPPPRHSLVASHSIASSSVAASCTSLSESRRALTSGRSFVANPLSGAFPAFPSVPKSKGMRTMILLHDIGRFRPGFVCLEKYFSKMKFIESN